VNAVASAISAKKGFSRVSREAADRLLNAVKEKLLREKGKVDYDLLRRSGYGETLIARLKELEPCSFVARTQG